MKVDLILGPMTVQLDIEAVTSLPIPTLDTNE